MKFMNSIYCSTKKSGRKTSNNKWSGCIVTAILIALILHITIISSNSAELIDRVVAYVDDQAITYSEFNDKLAKLKEAVPNISENEVINSMINSLLLLNQAKKMRLEAPTEDDLIKEYVDIWVKSRILIKEEQIRKYYDSHKQEFGGKDYFEVRDEIEKYLLELETNKELKEHLNELRRQSNIIIQLKAGISN